MSAFVEIEEFLPCYDRRMFAFVEIGECLHLLRYRGMSSFVEIGVISVVSAIDEKEVISAFVEMQDCLHLFEIEECLHLVR